MPTSPYPQLSPELQALSGDALRLWGDADERRQALEAILHAWEHGDPDLRAAVEYVDSAVEAGLRACGLPRGPVLEVRIEDGFGPQGRKRLDCSLLLGGVSMRRVVREDRRPDSTFRTWVHESLHARQAYATDVYWEYRAHRGFEEGMVEGLARLITREKAGLDPSDTSYAYYVAAYRALARAGDLDVEELWRALWQHPTGMVRGNFVGTIEMLRRSGTGESLTTAQNVRLQGIADLVFGSDRVDFTADEPTEGTLTSLWRAAFG